jgi:hypothetical protein
MLAVRMSVCQVYSSLKRFLPSETLPYQKSPWNPFSARNHADDYPEVYADGTSRKYFSAVTAQSCAR